MWQPQLVYIQFTRQARMIQRDNTTTPIYNKNWRASVAFHHLASPIERHFVWNYEWISLTQEARYGCIFLESIHECTCAGLFALFQLLATMRTTFRQTKCAAYIIIEKLTDHSQSKSRCNTDSCFLNSIMYSIFFVVRHRDVKVIILSINALLCITLNKVLIGR